jgi:putative ABC transport system permease protein
MLGRKLRRDLGRMKGQAVAVALVVACAVAAFVGTASTYRSLADSNQRYYATHGFAHLFARLSRAPRALQDRIAELPGVAGVEARIVTEAALDIPGFPDPAQALLVSLPDGRPTTLNRLVLLAGRWPAPGAIDEVLAGETFLKVHRLQPGAAVAVVLGGTRRTLRIVGAATTPEFIYQIRPGDLFPDDAHFGVFWTSERLLAQSLRLEGAFNDVVVRLGPDAVEPDVLAALDRLLEPYGGLAAYGRDRHVSHRFITDEVRQLKALAVVAPAIFLGVAAFLLNVSLSRLIGTQRELIATLKALGYSNFAVGAHYVQLMAVIVLAGVTVGAALGVWMGASLLEVYARFYHLPLWEFRFDPAVLALALLLSLGAGLAGTLGAVRRAVRLPPAEAMRPAAPPSFRPGLLERLGLGRLLSPLGRIVLRNLSRRPLRALLTALGVAAAASIIVVGAFMDDVMDFLVDLQFRRAQLEDAMVTFTRPLDPVAVDDLRRLDGVLDAEPFRSVPAVLRAGHRSYQLAVLGLPAQPRLHRIAVRSGRLVAPPPDGLLLTAKLAELLAVRPGDTLQLELFEGTRPRRTVAVAGTVDDLLGVSAYMQLDPLDRLVGAGPARSGAFLTVDPHDTADLYRRLKHLPAVAGVTLLETARRTFEATSAEYLLFMAGILVLFAVVIACGVVYNSARVSLAERERELASLRVLGFTRREVSFVLLGELAAVVVVAVPLGALLGWAFAALTAQGMDSDLFRLPLAIEPSTYAFAGIVVVAASLVTALVVRRRIDHLDLVEVLKTKE